MSEIGFLEIIDQKLPDVQSEVDWQGGVAGLPATTKSLLLVGPSALLNGVVTPITNAAKGISDYGEGSVMAGMIQAALTVAPKARLYGLSHGVGATASLLSSTFAGTATASGVVKIWIAGRFFQVPVDSGDTHLEVGAAVVATVTAEKYNLPATIDHPVTDDVVVVTSANLGACYESVNVRIDVSDVAGITVDVGGAGAAQFGEGYLSGGTTDISPAAVLAAIQGDDRMHLVCNGTEDATALTAISTHMETMSGPTVQKFGMGIAASVGGSATCQTLADTENTKRLQIVNPTAFSPRPVWEVAAAFAAARAVRDPRESCVDVDLNKWLMPPFDTANWPKPSDLEADLNEGVTPLRFERQGAAVLIARSIHTEHGGQIDNQKAWDHTIVEKADYYRQSAVYAFIPYKSKTLKTLSPAGRPDTMTPQKAKAIMYRIALKLDSQDYLDGVESDKDVFDAMQNGTNPDRIDIVAPYRPTRHAHMIAMQIVYTY